MVTLKTGNIDSMSVDTTTVSQSAPGIRKAWIRWHYRIPQPLGEHESRTFDVAVDNVQVNCAARTYRSLASLNYSGPELLTRVDYPDSTSFVPAAPQTLAEDIVLAACHTPLPHS